VARISVQGVLPLLTVTHCVFEMKIQEEAGVAGISVEGIVAAEVAEDGGELREVGQIFFIGQIFFRCQ